MKTCFKCSQELPLSEFYVHKQMADGHLNKCKDCTRKDTADRVSVLSKDPLWLDGEMERHRNKSRRYREEGRAIPLSPEKKREVNSKYNHRFPEKHIARRAVRIAVKSGNLIPMPCVKCGDVDAEGHHEDYSKPLDVIWLCPKHHSERHVEIRRKERLKTIH